MGQAFQSESPSWGSRLGSSGNLSEVEFSLKSNPRSADAAITKNRSGENIPTFERCMMGPESTPCAGRIEPRQGCS